MAAEDWLPDEIDEDAWYYRAPPCSIVCMFCQRVGFQWSEIWDGELGKYRFVLVDGRNQVHNCRVASASDFEDLTNVSITTPNSSSPAGRWPVSRPGNPAEARRRSSLRAAQANRRR